MYRKIDKCRICGNHELIPALDLGEQYLSGQFPRGIDSGVTKGPLRLVKCSAAPSTCGLLQLQHSYEPDELYGAGYGYRSGLNSSMAMHLARKIERIRESRPLSSGDMVIDIGSNDCTSLQTYPETGLLRIGVDPAGEKWKTYYPEDVRLIADYFSASLIESAYPGRLARIVTSFSMFYDLEDPLEFMREVHRVLAGDGIWVFEQSYMPAMLRTNSFDTVCHEHLEYYAMRQIVWMADRAGFAIRGVEFNDANGGSFSVTACKRQTGIGHAPVVGALLERERLLGLDTIAPFHGFAQNAADCRVRLKEFLAFARRSGKRVAGLGASTKGNVLLQYCGVTASDVVCIGEVNPEKYGCVTPGSWIPIVPESEALAMKADYYLVLPWHFRDFFLSSTKLEGARLVFPLPMLQVA